MTKKQEHEDVQALRNIVMANKKTLSFLEACIYTGISQSTMYKLTSSRKVPHSKLNGKKLFFEREKLDDWLLSNVVPTIDEIETAASTYITTKRRH